MKPIIKWVGGKAGNWQAIKEMLPPTYDRYYEPFLGGGAVLLELSPKEAYVNDINSELINMYIQVRDDVEGVIRELSKFDECHDSYNNPKEFYYDVRKDFNTYRGDKTTTQAARFIYLNKHCFNGLYRENSKKPLPPCSLTPLRTTPSVLAWMKSNCCTVSASTLRSQ